MDPPSIIAPIWRSPVPLGKIHTYPPPPHISGESTLVKDFVDILLLVELGRIDSDRLLRAIQASFE